MITALELVTTIPIDFLLETSKNQGLGLKPSPDTHRYGYVILSNQNKGIKMFALTFTNHRY